MTENDDLVGVFEIAKMAGVSSAAVANWRSRFDDFPGPVVVLRSGPVFKRAQVRRWLRKRRGKMATIISTINLKGGVGKSTTTVAMAEILSAEFGKKVLVIDLDPQTNATVMLIGETRWKNINDAGHTLARLFQDALEDADEKRTFDLNETLIKRVSNVDEVRSVDLLPSSLDLINVQDRLVLMPAGPFHTKDPTDILRRAIRRAVDDYDYVLIDCPPNLGIITLNGLRISDHYLIPTIPDVLSTYGIPQIVGRVQAFSDEIGEDVEPIGIAICKYREQSTVHRNMLKRLKKGEVDVFDTVIPLRNQIAASAEFTQVSTLRQKYGYSDEFKSYRDLTEEVMEAIQ